MRYNAEHKQRTRERILQEAAQIIRAEGADRVAVSAIMGRAGLTHGGFYAHFPSKEGLVAETIGRMFEDAAARRGEALGDLPPREALQAFIRFYLSRAHRDGRETGCPLPALSSDLPRLSPEARAAFGAGLDRMAANMAALLRANDCAEPETLAANLVVHMSGAVALSRSVGDPEQSRIILEQARRFVRRQVGLESENA